MPPVTTLGGFNGLTLEILGGFSAVVGIAAVALAVTALMMGTVGTLPAAGVIVASSLLGIAGFFGVTKGAELMLNQQKLIDETSMLIKGA